MTGRFGSPGAWVRRGWLASTVALGLALALTSWSNYRSARDALSTLHQGQADLLERAILAALFAGPADPGREELAQLLETHRADGLRYIGLVGSDGRVASSIGEPMPEPLVDPRREGGGHGPVLVPVGGRIRVLAFPFRPAASRQGGPQPPPPPPEGREFRGLIFEFEPLIATRLSERAGRSLGFGLAAAVVMTLAAFILWRLTLRHEETRRRLEHERRLSSLGEMSAVLAHEIRNPLASLKGHAQLLAEKLPPDSAERHKAERVIHETQRLENLTTDLLDFVRTGPLELLSIDPAALLQAAAEEVAPGGFAVDTAGAPRRWRLDSGRLHQALTNLLRNAQQASPSGVPPTAGVAVEVGRLVFRIRDHGDGLPRGDEDRIFEPFFTKRTSGTGLGLAVARRVAELHGGSLTADNHPQGGAEFRLALPPARE